MEIVQSSTSSTIKISPYTKTDMNNPKQISAADFEWLQVGSSTSEDEDGYLPIKIQTNIKPAFEGFGCIQPDSSTKQETGRTPIKIQPNTESNVIQEQSHTKRKTSGIPIRKYFLREPIKYKSGTTLHRNSRNFLGPRPVSLKNQNTQTEVTALSGELENQNTENIPPSKQGTVVKTEVIWFLIYVVERLMGILQDIVPGRYIVRSDRSIQRLIPEATKKSQSIIMKVIGFLLIKPVAMLFRSFKSLILALPLIVLMFEIWALVYEEPWSRLRCAANELTKERKVNGGWWSF